MRKGLRAGKVAEGGGGGEVNKGVALSRVVQMGWEWEWEARLGLERGGVLYLSLFR